MNNLKSNRGGVNYENNLSPSENKKWELVNFCEFDKYATKSYCAIHNVDENKNLGDITKVDENKLQDFNMICGGSPCFVAGTKVYTSEGYKNIEDVKVGDMVLTHKNRYMPVIRIGGEKNKEIYSMRTQGFLEVECTDYHPFYCKKSKTSNPEKIRLKDINKGYYLGSHINKKEENTFNLSDEDCWILGRYIADGHIRKEKRNERENSYYYQCILSIGNDKVEKLKNIVKTRHYSCYKHTESTHRVVFSSMELVNFIIEHNFGIGAENKYIPNFILNLPVNKLRWFLNGYMDGDGCEINGVYQATTISKQLAMSLSLVIQKVYRVGCCIYHDKRPDAYVIEGRAVKQKDTYMIRFRTNDYKHSWFIESDIIWYPIKEIKNTNRAENVFNIEVEEDHTYTANNIITFNCQDFSVAGKQKGSVWTCKECGHEYNPLTVHWSKRDYCPNCGSKNIEKTRSSLLVEYLRVVRANKPNFGIYENVKNIVGKQFKDTTFKLFTDELKEYGYNVYWRVLNAKHFGIPQNRERVYLIFIRKDLDNGKFKFPEQFDNGLRLKDMLEDEVDEKFYISDDKVKRLVTSLNDSNALLYDPSQVKREGKSREYTEYAPTLTSRDYKDPRLVNENVVKQVGNISTSGGGWNNPQVGRVYDPNGCSPTLNTCSGGGHEPKVICGCDKTYNNPKLIENANCITSREDRRNSNRKQEGTAVIENNCMDKDNLKTPDISYCLDASYYKGTTVEEYLKKHRRQLVFENNSDEDNINKVAIKQATKQGYIECELGGVADLSYPDSKTRRGRFQDNGNTCPTITATETSVCRIESKERFFNKDDVGSFYDYISVIFECLDCMKIATEGEMKNEERYQKFRKILYVLWEEIRKETVQWKARGFWSIPEEEILQSRMYGKIQTNATKPGCDMEDCTSNCTENKRKNIEKDEMRNMWKIWEVRCSSYKLELEGQFIEEFASVMSKLSYQNTQNKKCMLDMWRSDERTRILQQALFEIQKIRMSSDEKEKSRVPNLPKDDRESKKMCGFRIRKLTPKETFRLMGFSDNDFDAAQNAGISNSQLYKQAGNSIVVDVLYYIYRELYIAMPYLFYDLKLSSFFSGIGAFETGLDRLYKDINSGNFTSPQTE